MQFIKSKIKLVALLTLLSATAFKTHSQTNSDIPLYTKYDSIAGKENLGLYNGTLHTNPYKTIDDNNMYFIADKYSPENVVYDNQPYYNVNLKYDIYRDQIVCNPHGQADYIGINLIPEKTHSFSFHGKQFVNLTLKKNTSQEYIKGYYEEIIIGNQIILYIKHHKNILEITGNEFIYQTFIEANTIIAKYKDTLYTMNTKKDAKMIFPQFKREINSYFDKNKSMEKSNRIIFTQNLLTYINGFLISKSN
jgi:hypothetical protein